MAASTPLLPQLAATAATTALNLPQRRAEADAQSRAAQQQVASLQRRRSLIADDFEADQAARRLNLRRELGGARVSAAARGIAGDGGSEAALEQAQQSRHADATSQALAQRDAALADNGAAITQAQQRAQLAERERRLASSPARALGRSLLDTTTNYAIQQISLIR